MTFWGNRTERLNDPWCLNTPQVGLANGMHWYPDDIRDEVMELPPWSWLVGGPGNEAPQ
jgi:hypothetical protein